MKMIRKCKEILASADAILIGAGAGLTAAAGISYTDQAKFADLFPAWVKRGFSMQYQLMGYTQWSEAEKWGYYTIHLDYVYFKQKKNALYQEFRNVVGEKDYFVMTSNVDELFHKNGFARDRIYSPQGSYGKIQCTVPCSDTLWDIKPYIEKMRRALHPIEQVITDPECIPQCPRCGASMFINARVDRSFIETPYHMERERMKAWIEQSSLKTLALIEMGAGYNTPMVIRMPMEAIAAHLDRSKFIRVNLEHPQVPIELKQKSIELKGDIRTFIEEISA